MRILQRRNCLAIPILDQERGMISKTIEKSAVFDVVLISEYHRFREDLHLSNSIGMFWSPFCYGEKCQSSLRSTALEKTDTIGYLLSRRYLPLPSPNIHIQPEALPNLQALSDNREAQNRVPPHEQLLYSSSDPIWYGRN